MKNSCFPCNNGDYPMSTHCCVQCCKPVHLFGCAIKNVDSEEGYGKKQICLSYDELNKEINTEERL